MKVNSYIHRMNAGLAVGLVLSLALAVIAGACSDEAPPTPTPETSSSTPAPDLALPTPIPEVLAMPNMTWFVPPSLEEQMYYSDVIVRVSLLTATANVETVPSADDGVAPAYRPLQELRFTAHEYLKGSGASVVLVVVAGDRTYLTEAEAREEAGYAVSGRNTTWDGRQGVLFLNEGQAGSGGGTDSTASTASSSPRTCSHYVGIEDKC